MKITKNCSFFGSDAKFEHVGIAVRKIDLITNNLKKINDKIQNVNLSFINCSGLTIELVEPANDSSPVNSFLKKNQTYYHICFSVDNIDASIKKAKKYNFSKISKPVPAVAFNNRKIVWLYNINLGLVELLER